MTDRKASMTLQARPRSTRESSGTQSVTVDVGSCLAELEVAWGVQNDGELVRRSGASDGVSFRVRMVCGTCMWEIALGILQLAS